MSLLKALVAHGKLPELTSFAWWELCYRIGALDLVRFSADVPATPSADWSNVVIDEVGGGSDASVVPSPEPWMLLHFGLDGSAYGCLHTSPTNLLHRSQSGQIDLIARFPRPLVSVFVSQEDTVFACLDDGTVHRSSDGEPAFSQVLMLSTSASFVRFDHGMVDTGGGLLVIAEYGNVHHKSGWQSVANLYFSTDGGLTWECSNFFVERGVNKHAHLLRYSARLDALILTVGDNKKQTWAASLSEGRKPDDGVRWLLCNKRHIQTGGFTALVETESMLLFGTDYHGGTNFIVQSEDGCAFRKSALPDPYRRSPIYAMTKRATPTGDEIWATLHNAVNRGTRSLLMVTRDHGVSWTRVLDYDGSRNRIRFASASGDCDPETIYLFVTAVGDDDTEEPLTTLRISPQASPASHCRRT